MTVSQRIADWAGGLPYWEQRGLELVLRGVPIEKTDTEALLQFLLEDTDLAPKSAARPPSEVGTVLASAPPGSPSPRLLALEDLQNVNALAERQALHFGPALTVIYGGNGSGKSGYARVLGCAGFTRGDREVLPDVTKPFDDTTVLSADIKIAWDEYVQTIHYRIGQQCPELSAFYVFDSTSVRIHLCESNPLSFSPAGLSYLTKLADVTDDVRGLLQQRIEEASRPHSFAPLFSGESDVSRLIIDLGPSSDVARLEELAKFQEPERVRLAEIDLKIARLKSRDVSREIASLQQKVGDLKTLVQRIRHTGALLSDDSMADLSTSAHAIAEQRGVARALSVDQFKSPHLTQVGSEVWHRFTAAARLLAGGEAGADGPYPQPGAVCLLCQQPLEPEARQMLTRLWDFLEGEAQARLSELENEYSSRVSAISVAPLNLLPEDSVAYRHLLEANEDLLRDACRFLEVASRRRDAVVASLPCAISELPTLPPDPSGRIDALIDDLLLGVRKLEIDTSAQELEALEGEHLLLSHRGILANNLDGVRDYVARVSWAAQARKAGGTTAHITKFHNELFTAMVTDRYIELFEELLSRMGRSLKVKVATRGRKGAVLKQIAVQADPSVPARTAAPEKVLSEGEKRAVALADFLTEVALDTSSSGIVLDDPVTSLDTEWRELIACILASEAARRQVIVFTHDLPFLYYLKREADKAAVATSTHWIKRGDVDGRPGYVYLDNSPALERDYRNASRSRDLYAKARDVGAQEQELLLREGFGALRASYEAFVVFDLFNEVVMRFSERISFGRLKDVVVDRAIVEEVVDACDRLSRFIEGHLHSDAFEAVKPTPATLLEEIERFENLRARQREAKNR